MAALLESLGINRLKEERSKKDIFSTGIELRLGKKIIAELGVVHPKIQKAFSVEQEVVYAEMDFDQLYQFAFKQDIEVAPIPKYPSSRRASALLVDEHITFEDLKSAVREVLNEKFLTHINLFDVYEGKNLPRGRKSYGLSFHFFRSQQNLDR